MEKIECLASMTKYLNSETMFEKHKLFDSNEITTDGQVLTIHIKQPHKAYCRWGCEIQYRIRAAFMIVATR